MCWEQVCVCVCGCMQWTDCGCQRALADCGEHEHMQHTTLVWSVLGTLESAKHLERVLSTLEMASAKHLEEY